MYTEHVAECIEGRVDGKSMLYAPVALAYMLISFCFGTADKCN